MEYYVGQYLQDMQSTLIVKVLEEPCDKWKEFKAEVIREQIIDEHEQYEVGYVDGGWCSEYKHWKDITKLYTSPLYKVLND